jgi:hypothetical protein
MSKSVKESAATVADRQSRWRAARTGIEQRVEIWLPVKTAQSLKKAARQKGQSAKSMAAIFIERGLGHLVARNSKHNKE